MERKTTGRGKDEKESGDEEEESVSEGGENETGWEARVEDKTKKECREVKDKEKEGVNIHPLS